MYVCIRDTMILAQLYVNKVFRVLTVGNISRRKPHALRPGYKPNFKRS